MNWLDTLITHLENNDKDRFSESVDSVIKVALQTRSADLTNSQIVRHLLAQNGVDVNISPDCDAYIDSHPNPHELVGFLVKHEVLHKFFDNKLKTTT